MHEVMVARELSEEEIDTFLRAADAGVLSLAGGGNTYAVPQSFGYDGDVLYFQFVCDEGSDKMAFVETTEIATFTVSTENPTKSVVVRGELTPVAEDEAPAALAILADTTTLPTVSTSPTAAPAALSFELYRLEPEQLTGREFGSAMTNPFRD